MILLNSQLQHHLHQIRELDKENDNNSNHGLSDNKTHVNYESKNNEKDVPFCNNSNNHVEHCREQKNEYTDMEKSNSNWYKIHTGIEQCHHEFEKNPLLPSFKFVVPIFIGYFISSFIQNHPNVVIIFYQNDYVSSIFCALMLGALGIILHLFITLGTDKYFSRIEKRYNQQIDNYRYEIQSILGSVNAPSIPSAQEFNQRRLLQQQTKQNYNRKCKYHYSSINNYSILIHTKLVKFTKSHATLLKTIDQSIQMIQIATSLQLGLGPWSLSVNRVEINTILKANNNNVSGLSTSAPTVNLHCLREMLFHTLVKQCNSIFDIRRHVLVMIQDEEHKNVNTINMMDENEIYHLLHKRTQESLKGSKSLLTISLIKSMMVQLRNLLSDTLSMSMNFTVCSSCSSSKNANDCDDIIHSISLSTSYAKELNSYLTASFSGLGDESIDMLIEKCNSIKNNPEWRQLSQLQKHVDGAVVSLWAFQHSIQLDDNDEGKLFWNRLGDEIQNLTSLYLSINNIYDDVNNGTKDANKDEVIGVDNESYCDSNEKEEYIDRGEESSTSMIIEKETLPKDKILIFAGNGAREARRQTQKQNLLVHRDVSSSLSNNLSSTINTSIDHSILLRELQVRIQSLEKVEEWDVITNQSPKECSFNNDGFVKEIVKEKACNNDKSPTFFLGASGTLLSELKMALSNDLIMTNNDDDIAVE